MFKKSFPVLQLLALCSLILLPCLIITSTYAISGNKSYDRQEKTLALSNSELDSFSQNNVLFYDPARCSTIGVDAEGCFKVDSSVEPSDAWYAEGCMNNGTCTRGIYASTVFAKYNKSLLSDTKTDESFGGMQYIYAENFDIEFGGYKGWIAKFTPNGGNSTRKYYWIVLPVEAYSTGFGETYVATFENLSEPVYFIVYDTHQCKHQSERYCDKAKTNPESVAIGKQFFGALTKNGGNSKEVQKIVGKLTAFCRIRGKGEVTAPLSATNKPTTGTSSEASTETSSSSGNSTPQFYQDDSRWGSKLHGNSSTTLSQSGDGPTSLAMLVTAATGKEVFPDQIAEVNPECAYSQECANGKGRVEMTMKVCEKFGCEAKEIPGDKESIKQALKEGWMLHFSSNSAKSVTATQPFSKSGHYIGIFNIDDNDNVLIADSANKSVSYNRKMTLDQATNNYYFPSPVMAIKGNGSSGTDDGSCSPDSDTGGDVLKSVEEIIELANKNGSTYTWGGGHSGSSSTFDAMLAGAPINVDCTGFASLVMYKTYGKMTTFTSSSIFNDPMYEEIPRSEVRPGDIFSYKEPSGHGGIVIEVKNGAVTKIAETGGKEGRSGSNKNIGYSGSSDFSVRNMNGQNGHFFRWKGN